MSVIINTGELLEILEFTPYHHNIMLVGKHGIGKSRIITDFFEKKNRKVVTFFLGQMSDPGDIIGLPAMDGDKTDFHPPYWFPLDGKPIVLFLDELNRARPEILQCVMDLTLNKTLAGKKLPQGTQIISAVNEGEEYQLTDLDPALVSRFNIYFFSPTPAEWLLWAAENNIDRRVISFIERSPDSLDSITGGDNGLNKTADRRSWERVSEIITAFDGINKTVEKAIAGIIGVTAAYKFAVFLQNNIVSVNPETILSDFTKHRKELEPLAIHELTVLNEGCFRVIELEQNTETQKIYITNLELYLKWLESSRRKEVIAHWATLYDSAAYPKTKVAVLTHSSYIFQSMLNFIQELKL